MTGFVYWPLFIWFQCFAVVQLLIVGISRFTGPEGNSNIEILFVKISSLKQNLSQILPGTRERIEFCVVKKAALFPFRL